jgi:hypothetical protein
MRDLCVDIAVTLSVVAFGDLVAALALQTCCCVFHASGDAAYGLK